MLIYMLLSLFGKPLFFSRTSQACSGCFRKLTPAAIMFCALEHLISRVCYTLGTKTKMVSSRGKKVFLVGLLCKVALPLACAS